MLLVGWQEGHSACKKQEWCGAAVVVCLEQGADLHMAQMMPLPLTVSCFSKIQIGFTILVPAHLGSSGKKAVNGCVCNNLVIYIHELYLMKWPFMSQPCWLLHCFSHCEIVKHVVVNLFFCCVISVSLGGLFQSSSWDAVKFWCYSFLPFMWCSLWKVCLDYWSGEHC